MIFPDEAEACTGGEGFFGDWFGIDANLKSRSGVGESSYEVCEPAQEFFYKGVIIFVSGVGGDSA